MKNFLSLFIFCIIAIPLYSTEEPFVEPDVAFQRLKEGNERFAKDLSSCPNRDMERRAELSTLQHPFATILGCADSRVSPDVVFDQGVGDLFVVRIAGNVMGPTELDSILYSVKHLKSSLIVVLGHENCGAVHAVLEGQTGDIPAVAKLIEPAIKASKNLPGNRLEKAIKSNVQNVVDQLNSHQLFMDYVQSKKLKIVGGYYKLESGLIEFLAPTTAPSVKPVQPVPAAQPQMEDKSKTSWYKRP